MFERRGTIVIPGEYDEDTMMMASLDAGADDFERDDDTYVITTNQESFTKVRDALELSYVPNIEVELDEEGTEKVMNLVNALEDLDDVQDVYYNLK